MKYNNIPILFFCVFSLILTNKICAQIVNIPDANLKDLLVNNSQINSNNDNEIQISEAENYTGGISINRSSINSLVGLEAFTKITGLSIGQNNFNNISINAHTELTSLTIFRNDISTIDLSSNTKLKNINLDFNKLTSIDVSANPLLEILVPK